MSLGPPSGTPAQYVRRGLLLHPDHKTKMILLDDTLARDNVGGHTPTTYLREGLILTRITATDKYGRFDSTAVDGRQLMDTAVVLPHDVDMAVYNADLPVAAIYAGVLDQDRVLFNGSPNFSLVQRLIIQKNQP